MLLENGENRLCDFKNWLMYSKLTILFFKKAILLLNSKIAFLKNDRKFTVHQLVFKITPSIFSSS